MFLRDLKQYIGRPTSEINSVTVGGKRGLIGVVLAACLGVGCHPASHRSEPDTSNHRLPSPNEPAAPANNDKKIVGQDNTLKPLHVFAEKSFYLKRPEPEELFVGVFQRIPVQEGPNTRKAPFTLVVGTEQLRVYVAGFDVETLSPCVGSKVEIVGKRIDQRKEGYGIEIWIATITLLQ